MAGTPLIDAPRIVAERLGYFEDEGLSIDASSPGAGRIAGELMADPSAIALGGAWRPVMYRGRGVELSIFGTFCAAPPYQLVARKSEDFEWRALEGSVLVVPASAPSAEMALGWALAASGVDVTRVRILRGLDGGEAWALYAAGLGDYLLVAHPVPDVVSLAGAAAVASLARATGPAPWGVYYGLTASPATDTRVRFSRAVQRGLDWVRASAPEEIGRLCADRFPHASTRALVAGIEYCLEQELWPASTRIPEDALMRWQAVMQSYGLIDAPVPFDALVDTETADEAVTTEATK
jgi:ABC-type nitrate/sulfonate/bicarbonate transport system substrate-binding protein